MFRTALPCLLACAPLTAFAQSHATLAPAGEGAVDDGWSARAELGLAMSSGNTETESFVGKLDFAFSDVRHKLAFGASGHYATDDDVASARRYEAHGTGGFRLDPRSYVYGSLRNERDAFGTYEYQWTAAAGYGVEALRSEAHKLSLELGPGYRFAKDQGARVHHNEAIGRGMADWRWKLTANASLVDTLLFESGRDNTFVRNVLGVQVAVAEGLAMKAGLETRYNSDVEPGIENTDRLTTVNLVYRFK